MRKRPFIDLVAAKTGLTKKDNELVMDAIFQTLGELLANGDRLEVNGFGIFTTRTRAARTARNPRTGESFLLEAANLPVLRPSQSLRDRMNHKAEEAKR